MGQLTDLGKIWIDNIDSDKTENFVNLVYNSMAENCEREGKDSLEDEDDWYDPLLDDID